MLKQTANFFKESYQEMKKVVWPTKKETLNHTLLVIGISLAAAFLLGAADYLFTLILEKIIIK
jgi:preprotein translocase subunit SecE